MGKVIHKRGIARAPFENLIKDATKIETRIGYFESAKYSNGTPVAYIATIMEHGWAGGGIPARPTMRPTIARESNNWKVLMGKGANAVANGKKTLNQVMTGLGLQASGDVRKTIAQITTPPLKQATILKRANRYASNKGEITASIGKPLVDSSLMLSSTTFAVVNRAK